MDVFSPEQADLDEHHDEMMEIPALAGHPAFTFHRMVAPKSLECDFHVLSGRLRSTSTPFQPRTISKASSTSCTPTIAETSLEDSAIGSIDSFKSLTDSDESHHSVMSPSSDPFSDRAWTLPRKLDIQTVVPKLSLFQDDHVHEESHKFTSTSFRSASDDCLVSPPISDKDTPCLHCSREKSRSDSDLLSPNTTGSFKYSASQSHKDKCTSCILNHPSKWKSCRPKHRHSLEGPLMRDISSESSSYNHSACSEPSETTHSQDTGYQSNFTLSSFERSSSLEHSSAHKSTSTTSAQLSHLQESGNLSCLDTLSSSHECSVSLPEKAKQGSASASTVSCETAPVSSSTSVFKIPTPPVSKPQLQNIDFTSFLQRYAPKQLDRLIGRKMGLPTVDIVSELHHRSQIHPLSLIMKNLSAKDIHSMCRVSNQWQAAVESDVFATKCLAERRNRRLKQALEKENSGKKRSPGSGRSVTVAQGPLTPVQLVASTNTSPHTLPTPHNSEVQHVLELSQKYWKEAQQLKNEEALRKCPKCNSPAKTEPVQERAKCTRTNCNFDFCIRCRTTFHGSKDCGVATTPKKQRPEMKVCGRKSKKNLRRL